MCVRSLIFHRFVQSPEELKLPLLVLKYSFSNVSRPPSLANQIFSPQLKQSKPTRNEILKLILTELKRSSPLVAFCAQVAGINLQVKQA